jgi:DNA-binding SARP family transcriptional activator
MAARVVRFLLVRREHVQEDLLLEAFWRDSDPAAARRSLAVSLSRCRAVLRPGAIVASDRAYRLVLESGDRVDVDAFEEHAALALELPAGPARTAALERAAALWTGEPLPEDRYADWTRPWRDALSDRRREVLVALADVRAAAGEHGAALRAARSMLDADPLDEGAHRRVMAGYAALGRRSRALEQYLRCRRILVDAAGIEPARETTALHARILAGDEVGVAA